MPYSTHPNLAFSEERKNREMVLSNEDGGRLWVLEPGTQRRRMRREGESGGVECEAGATTMLERGRHRKKGKQRQGRIGR
jgi:hypothetical protein